MPKGDGNRLNLSNQKFGRLTALSFIRSNDPAGRTKWLCHCECGNIVKVTTSGLRNGNTNSCGCLKIDLFVGRTKKHGHSALQTKTYIRWCAMIWRCLEKNNVRYPNYSGRGIAVCERWKQYENFLADMGEVPKGMTLDRYPDNDGNYEPSNCRWATNAEQSRNKSVNHYIEFNGERMVLMDWAKKLGMPQGTLSSRLGKLGWSIEKALTTPIRLDSRNRKPTSPVP